MQTHTFTRSDLELLTHHALYHKLMPSYLTVDGRLAWRAFLKSSERMPLVPHPPKHPPPPFLHAPLLYVAGPSAAPLPAATSILGPSAPQPASVAILPDPPREPPSVLLRDQAKTLALTRRVAPTETSALGPVDVKTTKSQGTQTVIHRADGGAEHCTVRGETLEF